jgi:hypothetical protein
MVIKIKQFLLEDEKKDIRKFIRELEKHPEQELNESGGLGVKISENLSDGSVIYDVYKIIATVNLKRKNNKE